MGQDLRDGPVGGVRRRGELIAGQRAGQAAQAVERSAVIHGRGLVVMGSPSRVVVSSADRTRRPCGQRPPHAGRPRPSGRRRPRSERVRHRRYRQQRVVLDGPGKHSHSEGFRSATKIALRRSDLGGAEGIRTPDPLTARSKFTRAEHAYLHFVRGTRHSGCMFGTLELSFVGHPLDSPIDRARARVQDDANQVGGTGRLQSDRARCQGRNGLLIRRLLPLAHRRRPPRRDRMRGPAARRPPSHGGGVG